MRASWRWSTNSVRAFARLAPSERGVVVRALIAAPLVRQRLKRHSYREVIESLRNRPRPRVPTSEDATQVAALAEKTLHRVPATYTCLVRSIVVWWLVGGDASAEIRFGVAPPTAGETPRFHAWVEVDGVPINDAHDVGEHYLPFTPSAPKLEQFD